MFGDLRKKKPEKSNNNKKKINRFSLFLVSVITEHDFVTFCLLSEQRSCNDNDGSPEQPAAKKGERSGMIADGGNSV